MVKIQVSKPEKEVKAAAKLIESFLRMNGLNDKLTICLDYSLKCLGIYYYYDATALTKRVNPNKIYVNPSMCADFHKKKPSAFGYTDDFTCQGVLIHEFCHFVDRRLGLEAKFASETVINKNCDTAPERLAELFRLYITNPYFLFTISKPDYDFFREFVVTPVPASKEKFIALYNSWSPKVKKECLSKWGIYVNGDDVFHEDRST